MSGEELFLQIWYYLIECQTAKRIRYENDVALGYTTYENIELAKLDNLLSYISDNFKTLIAAIDAQKGDNNA